MQRTQLRSRRLKIRRRRAQKREVMMRSLIRKRSKKHWIRTLRRRRSWVLPRRRRLRRKQRRRTPRMLKKRRKRPKRTPLKRSVSRLQLLWTSLPRRMRKLKMTRLRMLPHKTMRSRWRQASWRRRRLSCRPWRPSCEEAQTKSKVKIV